MEKELRLEKIRYAMRRVLDEQHLDSCVDADAIIEDTCYGIAYQLHAERCVLALARERLRIDEVKTERVPADAWSAFRLALGWKWLLRWKPPTMKDVTVEVHVDEPLYSHVCPHLDATDREHHLRFFTGMDLPHFGPSPGSHP